MRSFVIFLALLLVCACGGGGGGGSGNPGDNNSDNNSDNNTDNNTDNGSSIISNLTGLKGMGDNCSRDYTLNANITVNEPWVAICSAGGGYTGTFDGGGKTITFTDDISGGLFAKLGENGKVKNAKIEVKSDGYQDTYGVSVATAENPGDIISAFGTVAALAGRNSSIDNCSVTIERHIGAINYTGGVVGYAGGAIKACSVTFNGDIDARSYTGGVAAYGDYYSSIDNCSAYIDGEIVGIFAAGGIAGYITGDENNPINNSYAIVKDNISSAGYSGGVAGYAGHIKNSYAIVDGNIGANSNNNDESARAGGVAGFAAGNITSSFAVVGGSINTATTGSGANTYAGGVAGYANGTIAASFAATSGISAKATGDNSNSYAGGAAGSAKTINNNFAFATVGIKATTGSNAKSYAGGIAGLGNTINKSVSVVKPENIDAADYKGNIAGSGGGSGNYAYMSSGGDETKDGKLVKLALLFSAIWWRDAGFDESVWHFEPGKLPMQKIYYDKGIEPVDLWSFVESASVKDPAYLTNTFVCNADFKLTTNVIITTPWTGLCSTGGYKAVFDGDNYTIIFKDNVTGGLFATLGDGYNAYTVKNLDIAILKDIKGLSSSGGNRAGGIAAASNLLSVINNCLVVVNGDIISNDESGGLVGYNRSTIRNSSVIVSGSIIAQDGVNGDAGGIAGIIIVGDPTDNSSAVVGGDIKAAYAGGIAGGVSIHNSTFGISDTYADIRGSISGNTAGGISSSPTAPIINSFAVIGSISSSSNAGGVLGSLNAGASISNSVAIVDTAKITGTTKGNIWGRDNGGSGTNNYIFTKGGTGFNDANSQNGQAVSAANLKLADWWRDVVEFDANFWHLENGYLPLPKTLYDRGISPSPFPDWVKDN